MNDSVISVLPPIFMNYGVFLVSIKPAVFELFSRFSSWEAENN